MLNTFAMLVEPADFHSPPPPPPSPSPPLALASTRHALGRKAEAEEACGTHAAAGAAAAASSAVTARQVSSRMSTGTCTSNLSFGFEHEKGTSFWVSFGLCCPHKIWRAANQKEAEWLPMMP